MNITTVLKSVKLGDDGYAELTRLGFCGCLGFTITSDSYSWDVVGLLLHDKIRLGAIQVAFASLDKTIPLTEVGRLLRTI